MAESRCRNMATDLELPEQCPSCRTGVFVGRKSAPAEAVVESDGCTVTTDSEQLVWDDAECDECGKKIVVDGEVVIDDSIAVVRDDSELSLTDFERDDDA